MAAADTFFYQALASPIGIVLEVSSVEAAIQQFVLARKRLADDVLADIEVRRSPINPTSEIWLVKKGVRPTDAFSPDQLALVIAELGDESK